MLTRRSFLSLAGATAVAGIPGRPVPAFRTVQARPAIDPARLRTRLERLSYHGRKPGGTFADGVNRVAYSTADLTARAWVIDSAQSIEPVLREAFAREQGLEPPAHWPDGSPAGADSALLKAFTGRLNRRLQARVGGRPDERLAGVAEGRPGGTADEPGGAQRR